jgi:ABC-2 type transport system permease protein
MSAGAPVWRSTAAQAGMELRLTARRGENVLVMIGIPAAVLLFFSAVPVADTGSGPAVDTLLPGTLALAVIATSLVNLGISTAYERSYGVLKRLGGTPLPRSGLLTAKMLAVLVVEVLQVILLVAIATVGLGWRPGPEWSPALLALGLVLGTAAFAGLGLGLAGALRAEATLALANALFLAFLLLGGVIVAVDRLPDAVAVIADLLPAAALSQTLAIALGSSSASALQPVVVLLAWAIGTVVFAARTFRWD